MVCTNPALTGSYDYGEVARSVLIAIAASYVALDLTGRVTAARGRIRLAWLSGGAVAMGLGIWAMHFKGMLAFHLPVPVEYHWPTVLASLLVAIFASAVALYVASRQKMGPVEALVGSVIMGAGIVSMHYIGMVAMRLPATTRYSPILVTCSLLLAILSSLIALLMAFDLREETRWTVPRRLGSAIVMGAAVSAMHYTGMAAANFIPSPPADFTNAVSISAFGNSAIGLVTLIVLTATIVTSSIDVTERRRTEEQLRQAQVNIARVTRVIAMGELAAAIAHELNQPLAAIVTNASFCLRQLARATLKRRELCEAISEIVNDGTRASDVISRIRALLRKSAPQRLPVDLNRIIQEVTILLRSEMTLNHVSLRTNLAADLPRVSADPVQLQQILINLCLNGIEAMRWLTDRRRELFIKSSKHQNEVSIEVQDSGTGIDPEQAKHIFEPFFTTKPEGIGMGLSISRSIVESHGGRLWAAPSLNGTVFQFTLPIK